jgi:hypothetical protein
MKRCIWIFALLVVLGGCNEVKEATSRPFLMGFQASAPRFDFDLLLQSLDLWVTNDEAADAAMITTEVPWEALLSGKRASDYVNENYTGLVQYYRQHNLKLWVYIDPANGLNRASDAQALVAAGRSIANEDMQAIYKRFVIVMDSILKPEHLGLALETNLIRAASPQNIYTGIKKASAEVAADLRSRNSAAMISVSVQADVAWGSLQGTFQYEGIAQDLIDFPFMNEMGISSYPYFGYDDPKDIPDDYYSKLADQSGLPVFVSEGGWTSRSITGPNNKQITSSNDEQVDYFYKQEKMLRAANATGWFSLTFTDIDLTAIPSGVDPSIQYFAYLGVVDKDLKPKPAFKVWKDIFGLNYE